MQNSMILGGVIKLGRVMEKPSPLFIHGPAGRRWDVFLIFQPQIKEKPLSPDLVNSEACFEFSLREEDVGYTGGPPRTAVELNWMKRGV